MTKSAYLKTTDIARSVGIHPNTVRLYEAWGFLPPIPRAPNGYRCFTEAHLEQLRLGRMALHGEWPGPAIRESALALVRIAATGDLDTALATARRHLELVREERQRAEAAAEFLQRWARGEVATALSSGPLLVGQVAERLDVTVDMLRDWERNGLLTVPRDPVNGYRRYGATEIGRVRVIRLLRLAGYSPMAILRMVLQLDQNPGADLRRALDTPGPDEDVFTAFDRWLSALAGQEERAKSLIAQIEKMRQIGE